MRRSVRLLLFSAAVTCAIAAGLATILAAPSRASAQTNTERITSYDARIVIQHNGSILVREQTTYDFGTDRRHGIFRVIPVVFRYHGRYDRIYPIDVRSVWSDTPDSEYSVDRNGSSISIKIGNPDRTVTGVHRYMITYVVRGSLNAFADHDELYWNAVGNQWDVPIDQATVRVSAAVAVSRAACFAGPLGSANTCQHAAITKGVASFSQNRLGPREGLTVVVAIPTGVVASPGPILRERWTLQRAFAVTPVSGGAAGGLLAVLAVAGAVVLARRRDRQHSMSSAQVLAGRPVRAGEAAPMSGHGQPPMECAPPEDVRPGQAGTLLHGAARPRDVTGTIVDLAVRGYLRIEDLPPALGGLAMRQKRDWRLIRLNKRGGLLDYEQMLLDGLFNDARIQHRARSTRLSELGPAFTGSLKQAQDALYADAVKRGWFTARPDRVRRRWLISGGWLFVTGTAATIAAAAYSHFGLVPVPVALAGLVLIGSARRIPVRTAKGTELTRKLLGFRRYLTTTAAGQTHPAGQDTLDTYLPYAIVFGRAKQWAAATQAVADADQAPPWYHSSGPYRPGSLSSLARSAYYFSSMHHFATSTNSWIANSASGNQNGFLGGGSDSGFSGGGFSGGGGGGGGGGSW
ncbi:MAG TPA: DUF2207 domain-containing protein [Streptosporangiaceae bacterium]